MQDKWLLIVEVLEVKQTHKFIFINNLASDNGGYVYAFGIGDSYECIQWIGCTAIELIEKTVDYACPTFRRHEAIMLIKLSIVILSSVQKITYNAHYSQNYATI